MELSSVFGHNMVLQQGIELPIWGQAAPGETVTVRFSGQQANAQADAQGRWRLSLQPLSASSQAQTLEVLSDRSQVIAVSNVLVGEVWLCSGQSNMEFRLSQARPSTNSGRAERVEARNGSAEAAAADFPTIRLLTIPQRTGESPASEMTGLAWDVCTPQTAGIFSAVGYFFGRELHGRLGVPIGLINASWGGTVAEAWTSRQGLLDEPALREMMETFERDRPRFQKLHEEWQAVMDAHEAKTADRENAGLGRGWAALDEPAGEWGDIKVPGYWQNHGFNFSGILWYRKVVEIPSGWAGRDLTLSIGAVDKSDVTYFNNVQVGSVTMQQRADAWSLPRVYRIPAALVKSGRNVIAVRAHSNKFAGGMTGPADSLFLSPAGADVSQAIRLDGQWRVAVEKNYGLVELPKEPNGPGNPNSPSALYNGMIAPLVPFGVRGAIWYQGESNADRAEEYRKLFPALIRDWRRLWGQRQFAFHFVQLANFMGRKPEPSESQWAELREAQTMTLSLEQTGMAVAIDIGDADDIHPANKQDVGKRLALNALHHTYGQKSVVPCGPLFRQARTEGAAIRLSFDYAGGLKCRGEKVTGFAIAGTDGKFVWAQARIEQETVRVWSPAVPHPTAVRYAWDDNPQCNLVNVQDLPASPFRTR